MPDGTPCALHPSEAVVGACQRCGDFICRLCIKGSRLVCAKCNPRGDGPAPDIGVALRYVFNDPDWVKKVAIGGACFFGGMIVIFPLFFLMGYQIRVATRERDQPQTLLPEWDGFGDLLASGFKCWLSQLIPVCVMLFGIFGLIALAIGIGIVAGAGGMQGGGGSQVAGVVAGLGFFGAILLTIPISLLFAFFMPAVQVHYVRTGKITAALDLRQVWRISVGRFGDYILLFIFLFLLQMVATIVGELVCGIGLFVTMPWMMIVQGYLVGRYAGWLDTQEGKLEF